jgi:hypothetical protein
MSFDYQKWYEVRHLSHYGLCSFPNTNTRQDSSRTAILAQTTSLRPTRPWTRARSFCFPICAWTGSLRTGPMGNTSSHQKEMVLAIVPKCTASVGLLFAIMLLKEVYDDSRRGLNTAIKRALVGMTCIDILSSSAWWLSSWAVPRGSYAMSAGTQASCSYQGFMLQLAIGAPLYNCSLSIFYLLLIKYRWSDERIRLLEKYVHGSILCFSFGSAVILLPLGQYNQINSICWIQGSPIGCGSSTFPSGDVLCERGSYAWLYGVSLFYAPLWVCMILCVGCMFTIHFEVQSTFRRLERYSVSGSFDHRVRGSDSFNRVAQQALLYTLAFVATWMPSTIASIGQWFGFSHFGLSVASAACEPLQSLWNFLVFTHNRSHLQEKLGCCWKWLHLLQGPASTHPAMGVSSRATAQKNIHDVSSNGATSQDISFSGLCVVLGQAELAERPLTTSVPADSTWARAARQVQADESESDVEQQQTSGPFTSSCPVNEGDDQQLPPRLASVDADRTFPLQNSDYHINCEGNVISSPKPPDSGERKSVSLSDKGESVPEVDGGIDEEEKAHSLGDDESSAQSQQTSIACRDSGGSDS